MSIALALLVYPGLALALVLALIFRLVAEDGALPQFGRVRLGSVEVLITLLSIALSAVGLALLPWPLHPAAAWPWLGAPVLLWALFEGAFLLPLLSGLCSPAPTVARAASREAQIGVAGRALVWLALGLVFWRTSDWTGQSAPGYVLLALGGLLALPAAVGVGPFAPERLAGVAADEEGLGAGVVALHRFARSVRSAALLAALIVAALPHTQMQPVLALVVAVALFIVVALLLRQTTVTLPRFTLPGALRWCWTRALPVLAVGAAYLGLTQ